MCVIEDFLLLWQASENYRDKKKPVIVNFKAFSIAQQIEKDISSDFS